MSLLDPNQPIIFDKDGRIVGGGLRITQGSDSITVVFFLDGTVPKARITLASGTTVVVTWDELRRINNQLFF